MNKKKKKFFPKNPNLIPGIYNYCDRWCERCEFTHRCTNFELSKEHFPDADDLDISNKVFWEQLHEFLQMTMEMVKETAEEQGIDLDAIDYESIGQERKELRDRADSDECVRLGKDYIELVNNWFDSAKDTFNKKIEEFELTEELGLPNTNSMNEADDLNSITEVIRWYQHQIYVKLLRATSGKLDESIEPPDDFPKDSDGSTKVALIGMDRSIAAWGKLLSIFPEQEDEIFKILVLLERLRKKTETNFPEARSFVRPGFDEI